MSVQTRTKTLSQKTIDGLLAIAAAVLANPKDYNQEQFVNVMFDTDTREIGCLALFHSQISSTERAHKLRVKKTRRASLTSPIESPFFSKVKKDFKLDDEQTRRLFGSTIDWPEKFRTAYNNANAYTKARARVAERRIKHFIKTNGAE